MTILSRRGDLNDSFDPTFVTEQREEVVQDVWNIATYRMFPLLLESMLYALYVALMIFYCLRFYMKHTQRVWWILVISFVLFVLSTVTWALDVSVLWLEMYRLLPSRLSSTVPEISAGLAIEKLDGGIKTAHDACEVITIFMSDIVALWRAYLIYGKPRWLKVVSIIAITLSTALYILNEMMIFGRYGGESDSPSPAFWIRYWEIDGGKLALIVQATTLSTTACAQLLATILLAWKAWIHRRQLNDLLPNRRSSSKHQRPGAILYVIIETGAAYTFLRVLYVYANYVGAIETGNESALIAFYWATAIMCQISGMYPTLIIFLVSLRESLVERSVASQSAHAITSIRFAPSGADDSHEDASHNRILDTFVEVDEVDKKPGGLQGILE
ncbi:unnamed protein product [Peniophora sp. CBMAI 1063]|nr:unnamed protein product [Peniophora sp. CBMAI 1063]